MGAGAAGVLAERPGARRQPILRVDLTEVTAIDAAGRACLATLQREGAELVSADCLPKGVVAEITHTPGPDGACPKGEGVKKP